MFEEKTQVPAIDSKYFTNYLGFYKELLEALKEDNYIFDENKKIFVSSGKFTIISIIRF